jgi:NADH-quinone oxidoreductase subunit L
VGGYVDTPPHFGGVPALSNFLNSVLPALEEVHIGPITETITALCASTAFALGLGIAYLLFGPQRSRVPATNFLEKLWLAGWGFDWLYDKLLVRPFQWLTSKSARELADAPINGLAWVTVFGYQTLRRMQTGRVRWYATGLAMGTVVILAIALFVR